MDKKKRDIQFKIKIPKSLAHLLPILFEFTTKTTSNKWSDSKGKPSRSFMMHEFVYCFSMEIYSEQDIKNIVVPKCLENEETKVVKSNISKEDRLLFNSRLEFSIDPKTKNRLTQNRLFLLSILVWVEEFKNQNSIIMKKILLKNLKTKI
jgi:hypothetical protein